VSTNSDEQKTSYDAQVSYYTEHIKSKDEWTFAGVYTDKGISGTSTKNREGFNRMMRDALDGKIDLIITKSVSRFARNTVDTLVAIRKLKDKGVEVYFEEQNIYTMDSKGEVLLTIMSSLAQDESRNISENVTWGQRKRFADGKVTMAYGRFLGYRKGKDGQPEIDEDEAVIVRRIYREFLEGRSPHAIAKGLKADGVLTPGKKGVNWQPQVVKSILTNEKYKGDALLQKTFTVDFLAKKVKKNEGEVQQVYVENSHPAIIDPEAFDQVQAELDKSNRARHASAVSVFSGRIFCADCGGMFGSKVWHSTDQYRRVVWRCNAKYKNKEKCQTPHLTEEELRSAFVEAFNRAYPDQQEVLRDYKRLLCELTDMSEQRRIADGMRERYDAILAQIQDGVMRNARVPLDQEAYQREYDALLKRAEEIKERLDAALQEISQRELRRKKLARAMRELEKRDALLTAFDGELWVAIVEDVTVERARLVFRFRDGREEAIAIKR
ncbi:MAG: recombinase family protein, partial [Clostridia bacterium]|nr:recombinase family protein [Clostridia bacterium]